MQQEKVRMENAMLALRAGVIGRGALTLGSGETDAGEAWVNLVDQEGFIRVSLSENDGLLTLNVAGRVKHFSNLAEVEQEIERYASLSKDDAKRFHISVLDGGLHCLRGEDYSLDQADAA